MVDSVEISKLLEGLMKEHDTLLQEREAVRQEEEKVTKRREELDRKIAGLQQSLQGLSLYSTAQHEPTELTENLGKTLEAAQKNLTTFFSGERPKTLTECCREILTRNEGWMSPLRVRQSLHAAGFDFSEYKSNPLSSIHTTLKRIAESGQAETHYDINSDETLYRWKKSAATTAIARPSTPSLSPDMPPLRPGGVLSEAVRRKQRMEQEKKKK